MGQGARQMLNLWRGCLLCWQVHDANRAPARLVGHVHAESAALRLNVRGFLDSHVSGPGVFPPWYTNPSNPILAGNIDGLRGEVWICDGLVPPT